MPAQQSIKAQDDYRNPESDLNELGLVSQKKKKKQEGCLWV